MKLKDRPTRNDYDYPLIRRIKRRVYESFSEKPMLSASSESKLYTGSFAP